VRDRRDGGPGRALAIQAGEADVALVVGVEKMGKMGMLGAAGKARTDRKVFTPGEPLRRGHGHEGILGTGLMPGVFAQAGMDYARQNGVTFQQFAKVAEKNHFHSALKPARAVPRRVRPRCHHERRDDRLIPTAKLMCCPTGDGAAALVMVSDEKRRSLSRASRAQREVSASVLTTDPLHAQRSRAAGHQHAHQARRGQGLRTGRSRPDELDLVELHDCFATAELVHYDNLRLCEPGGAGDFIDSGAPRRDGRLPVNVSGGLISKGHPIGATGVAGLYEVATHLRGEAGDRQVDGARVGLATSSASARPAACTS